MGKADLSKSELNPMSLRN